jgi:hypothetical protein
MISESEKRRNLRRSSTKDPYPDANLVEDGAGSSFCGALQDGPQLVLGQTGICQHLPRPSSERAEEEAGTALFLRGQCEVAFGVAGRCEIGAAAGKKHAVASPRSRAPRVPP